jgi:ectoine hydroxylase-related dioxygenase (phytanoyl-CoA dioxygenase family)
MLSETQVNHFREMGYLAIDRFFDAQETRALQAGFEELLASGVLVNVATEGDGKTKVAHRQNLQVCPLSYHHRLFAALPFHPKVRQAVSQLLNGDVYKFLDQIFYKPGKTGAGTNWHQDNYCFQMPDPFAGTAMWVALHNATEANGTLRVIPKALARILEHSRDPESDHHSRCWPDETQAVPIVLNAGGVVFFCFNTPHATGANRTNAGRAGLAYHFLNLMYENQRPDFLDIMQQGHHLYGKAGAEHGPILSGARYTGGQAEYNCDMTQVLNEEIARLSRVA